MRKITRSKHPEKRRNTKWNASGSTLAMNRQVVDTETVVYAMMCAMIASLIFYSSFVAKAIKWGAGLALAIAFALRIGAPGSELERRLHGWPMKIIFAVFGVAVAPSVIEIISEQLSTAGFFSFTFS